MLFRPRVHGCRFRQFRWGEVDLISMENELLRIVILPEKGADLIEFRYKPLDLDFFWHNPFSWPPAPPKWGQTLDERGPFFDTCHGGWQVSVPNGFFPTDYFGGRIGVHGDLTLRPWSFLPVEDEADRISLRMRCVGTHCPLEMARVLTLETGIGRLLWTETLRNLSPERIPVMRGHHPSFGGPLLEGASFHCLARTIRTPPNDRPELAELVPDRETRWPFVETRAGGSRDLRQIPGGENSTEHVVMLKDFEEGYGCIFSPKLGIGIGLRWDEGIFPWAWSWQCRGGPRQYPLFGLAHVITIQPSTSPLRPLEDCVKTGQVLYLEPGGEQTTCLCAGPTEEPERPFSMGLN